MKTNRIITADAFDALPELPDESIHAVVTDPPYGLAFMGRDWDDFEAKEYQEWCEEWGGEVKRVLKPGGHLLAFSGNRTHHRLFTGIEDAGFEIRDTITWHYGTGFPKAADVSKVIDKRADAEREVVETRTDSSISGGDVAAKAAKGADETIEYDITTPATDAAKEWDGWKTGLKPATEFVVMARKPSDGATVDSVLEHGTGALNIDGCRIGAGDDGNRDGEASADRRYTDDGGTNFAATPGPRGGDDRGRYPANVIFHEDEAERLDSKNETTVSSGGLTPQRKSDSWTGEGMLESGTDNSQSDNVGGLGDKGGPSRYFYTSKASRDERTRGGAIENDHPTVKPIDLMRWLVRLVTAEGQVVLDPFAGSGTTCMAAKDLGREFIGVERQERYADIARARVGLTVENPGHLTDDEQATFADGGNTVLAENANPGGEDDE